MNNSGTMPRFTPTAIITGISCDQPGGEHPAVLVAAKVQTYRQQQPGVPKIHRHRVEGKAQDFEKLDEPMRGRQARRLGSVN